MKRSKRPPGLRFEIGHQAEEAVYDDANGNLVESPRGYWFRIVDKDGDVLAVSEENYRLRASAAKVIREIIKACANTPTDHLIVDLPDEDS